MLKLIKLLATFKQSLKHKPEAFKQGFEACQMVVEQHCLETGIINENALLKQEIEELKQQLELRRRSNKARLVMVEQQQSQLKKKDRVFLQFRDKVREALENNTPESSKVKAIHRLLSAYHDKVKTSNL